MTRLRPVWQIAAPVTATMLLASVAVRREYTDSSWLRQTANDH